MIITEKKPIQEVLDSLKGHNKVFIIGCGECATTCKTGGEAEVMEMKKALESSGKTVTGFAIPQAPCIASQTKIELSKSLKALRESQERFSLFMDQLPAVVFMKDENFNTLYANKFMKDILGENHCLSSLSVLSARLRLKPGTSIIKDGTSLV